MRMWLWGSSYPDAFVSSAACEIDSSPMNETIATVMPQPKFDQETPVPSCVILCENVEGAPDKRETDDQQKYLADDAHDREHDV